MIEIILACLLIMGASLVALVMVSKKAETFVKTNIHFLMAFAVGVFAIVAYNLLSEAVEHGSFITTTSSVATGFLVMLILPRLIPDFHHHHTSVWGHSHSPKSALRILASDAVHNSADGILLGATYLATGGIGIGIFLSVFIHEVVQGITEFIVLKQAGYSSTKAITRNFLVQSTILVGALGAFFFLEAFQELEPVLLGLAAGGFFAVLLEDLIPSSIKKVKSWKDIVLRIVVIAVGVMLMLTLGHFLNHEQSHHEHEKGVHLEHSNESGVRGQRG